MIAALGGITSVPASADTPAVHYYVSVGDSLAQGAQPNGDYEHGYADALYSALKAADPSLQLVKLGCGGETTTSMIDGTHFWPARGERYFCGYGADSALLAHGSQLADAVAFLRAHRAFVSLVTIDIGGNDVQLCIYELDQGCLTDGLGAIKQNLPTIISALREASGSDVPIIGMNYYNPLLALWFSDPGKAAVTNDMVVDQVNPVIEQVYANALVPVADVQTAFSTTDWSGKPPVNVLATCRWTWMCDSQFGPDIHANTAGYKVIAGTFEALLP